MREYQLQWAGINFDRDGEGGKEALGMGKHNFNM